MTYKLLNSIPFTELNSNDIYALTICNEVAKQSEFINAQKRLGAYLNYGKNRYFHFLRLSNWLSLNDKII